MTLGEELHVFVERLFPINRSITGPGLRETLARIGERIPLDITEVPTGTRVLDWAVPKEWTLRDGKEEFFWPENARFVCNQGDGLRQAALRGLGLIMQPEVLLADDLASGTLVPVMQHCLPVPRPMHLVYAPDLRQLPKLARFVEHVVGALGVA